MATQCTGGCAPNDEDKRWGAGTIENYTCQSCSKNYRFPRYNHPQKLLGRLPFLVYIPKIWDENYTILSLKANKQYRLISNLCIGQESLCHDKIIFR